MYVKQYQDEYGRTRRYFRYKGLPLAPLPGRPGSPEFWDAYNIALAEARAKKPVIGAARLGPGTMGAVIISYFNDTSFKDALAESSQGMRRRILEKIAAKYSRRMGGLVEVLKKAGFAAVKPKGSFFLYVKAPKSASGKGGQWKFENAESCSQWLITEKLISTVPWDDAGAYLRWSVTFSAKDAPDEQRVLNEIRSRLSDVTFQF